MSAIATAAMHKRQDTELVRLMTEAKVETAPTARKRDALSPRWEVNGWTAPDPRKGMLVRRRGEGSVGSGSKV